MTLKSALRPSLEMNFRNELHLTLRPGASVIEAPRPDGRRQHDLLPDNQRPDGSFWEETT
jgi:hypothetical protein